jgi:hypothetical protein
MSQGYLGCKQSQARRVAASKYCHLIREIGSAAAAAIGFKNGSVLEFAFVGCTIVSFVCGSEDRPRSYLS